MAAPTKIEFAVEMTCDGCVQSVKKSLNDIEGIGEVIVNLDQEQVLVETTLPSSHVKDLIESTGKRAVLKGYGSTSDKKSPHLGAAVSIMEAGHNYIKGVIRLVQTDEDTCVIDGTLDGLPPGRHGIFVHEYGDLSDGCHSCGEILENAGPLTKKMLGAVGDISTRPDGRSEFRMTNTDIKVWDLIGRSIVIHNEDTQSLSTGKEEQRLVCGIVARSAGLFENTKKICACDGVSLWDERDVPIAGAGRNKSKI